MIFFFLETKVRSYASLKSLLIYKFFSRNTIHNVRPKLKPVKKDVKFECEKYETNETISLCRKLRINSSENIILCMQCYSYNKNDWTTS